MSPRHLAIVLLALLNVAPAALPEETVRGRVEIVVGGPPPPLRHEAAAARARSRVGSWLLGGAWKDSRACLGPWTQDPAAAFARRLG